MLILVGRASTGPWSSDAAQGWHGCLSSRRLGHEGEEEILDVRKEERQCANYNSLLDVALHTGRAIAGGAGVGW